VILLEWDDLENARQFAQSDDLRETMQQLGDGADTLSGKEEFQQQHRS
jgi:hypothetical protein